MAEQDHNETRYGNRKLSRRQMLRLMGGAGVGVLLTACGGNQAANTSTTQPNAASTQGGGTANTSTTQGGNTLTTSPTSGGAKANAAASPTSLGGVAKTASPVPATTQAPVTSVSAQNFKEAPQLQQTVQAGKLPKVQERLPQNPMVVQPVEKVGKYGGEWRTGLISTANASGLLRRTIGYEGLVRQKPDGIKQPGSEGVIPNLAESYDISQDGSEYTFKLRKGIKWLDGKPFNADDIMFWYSDVFGNKDLTPAAPGWLTTGKKPVVVNKVDDYTITFKFAGPNGLFMPQLAIRGTLVRIAGMPAHYLKQYHIKYNQDVEQQAKQANLDRWADLFDLKADPWHNPELPVLHAWILTSGIGANAQQLTAERNPYYWKVDTDGNQLPYLDKVVFTVVRDEQVLVLKTANGELDMVFSGPTSSNNKPVLYKNRDKDDYHFFDIIPTYSNTMVIALNLTHKDPQIRKTFQNKDFRIGLSYALNRPELIDVVYRSQGEPYQVAPRPEATFYNEKFAKQYTEFDINKANDHLDKVLPKKNSDGVRLRPDGKPLFFQVEVISNHKDSIDALQLVKKYWAKVGIDMRVKTESRDLFQTRVQGNEPDAVEWLSDGGLGAMLLPRWYFPYNATSFFAVPWAAWYQNPKDESAIEPPAAARQQMKLYDRINSTADPKKQKQLMKQLLDIAQEQFWVMGISLEAKGYGVVKNDFHNVPTMISGGGSVAAANTNPCQYFKES